MNVVLGSSEERPETKAGSGENLSTQFPQLGHPSSHRSINAYVNWQEMSTTNADRTIRFVLFGFDSIRNRSCLASLKS